jgi:hypothetical protein
VHCDYPESANYNAASDTESLTINKANPTVTASAGAGNPYTYDTSPHTGSCTVTGVGGVDLGPLSPTHTPTDPPVNAGAYVVHCDYPESANYNAASDTESLTINKATPTVTASAGAGNPYTFDNAAHEGSCTVTGVGGADLGPLDATHTPTDPPINSGTYVVHCDYPGSTNYDPASATATLTIGTRDALVNYIGQQVWVTSGTSATTAQVTLSASVQDPSGLALVGAKMTFIDITNGLPGKVLAADVPVAAVQNQPNATGTANKIVTLSTGQYGAESYLIRVVMTGNYDNTDQPTDDKTATVVVAKPAATNETSGGGEYVGLGTSAGLYKGAVGEDGTFSIGMKYNKGGANLQGKITVSVPQADGSIVYFKSNSISSMAVVSNKTPKTSTIYTKSTVYRVMPDASMVTIDGNVTPAHRRRGRRARQDRRHRALVEGQHAVLLEPVAPGHDERSERVEDGARGSQRRRLHHDQLIEPLRNKKKRPGTCRGVFSFAAGVDDSARIEEGDGPAFVAATSGGPAARGSPGPIKPRQRCATPPGATPSCGRSRSTTSCAAGSPAASPRPAHRPR